MKKSALQRRFPSAAQGFLSLNDDGAASIIRSAREAAELERDCGNPLDDYPPDQGGDSAKYLVRITSIRNCLLDEDNLCEKFHVDCLRYAGIIPSDAPDTTHIETTQRRCAQGEEEKTLIEVFRI